MGRCGQRHHPRTGFGSSHEPATAEIGPEDRKSASWLFHTCRASIVTICRHVWNNHEADLRSSGPLFYTWQYDIRWAATRLRADGTMRPAASSSNGIWELA